MEKLEAALELQGQPVKRGTMAHEHIVYMMLAEAAARIPDSEALKRFATRLEELAGRDHHRPYLAVANRAWGIVHRLEGDYDRADSRLREALSIFKELESRWQIGRTELEMAELKKAIVDREGARDHLTKALALFKALGAGPDLANAQAALAEVA